MKLSISVPSPKSRTASASVGHLPALARRFNLPIACSASGAMTCTGKAIGTGRLSSVRNLTNWPETAWSGAPPLVGHRDGDELPGPGVEQGDRHRTQLRRRIGCGDHLKESLSNLVNGPPALRRPARRFPELVRDAPPQYGLASGRIDQRRWLKWDVEAGRAEPLRQGRRLLRQVEGGLSWLRTSSSRVIWSSFTAASTTDEARRGSIRSCARCLQARTGKCSTR
jgi:hypothetical protein